MSGRRPLSRSELDLWRRSTADVKPLAKRRAAAADRNRAEDKKAHQRQTDAAATPAPSPRPSPPPRPPALAPLDPRRPVDIDRRSWERLKRGQVEIEKRLDLHGRTQREAHDALGRFLAMASAAGLRCVLVITGKGGLEGRGALRRLTPLWLGEPGNRDKVLTYCPAQPRHGGDGALYVLLRRRRDGGTR